MVGRLEEKHVTDVITGMPARRSPYCNLVELDAKGTVQLSKPLPVAVTRRQDSPKCYDMNASIYVWWKDVLKREKEIFLKKSHIYIMPKERSIDIDDDLDFKVAEFLLPKDSI